jgi:PTH1 family peptidyl-tRNA hydrolase
MPETFMNRSGEVVLPIARFLWEDVRPEDVLVVYDDMDLPVAGLRIRPHGGAGGQKGMRSIIETLGTDRFRRLRIGIGRPGTDAARHVLSRFDANERVEMDISVAEASEAILDWLETGDIEGCMTRFHSRWTQDS